jgi:hypothetical protein
MTRRFLALAATATLAMAIASPAAAVTPAYMKICGVDGESSAPPEKPAKATSAQKPQADIITGAGPGAGPGRDVRKPARTAGAERPKPERRTTRPNIAVGDINGDGRTDSRPGGRRDVKPPSPKPAGLLVPAIQKAR